MKRVWLFSVLVAWSCGGTATTEAPITTTATSTTVATTTSTTAPATTTTTSTTVPPIPSDCTIGGDHPTGELVKVPGESEQFGAGRVLTFTLEIEEGLGLDHQCVLDKIMSVISDPRGWTAHGKYGFRRVETKGSFRLIVASPDLTDRICLPLRTGGIYSCSPGGRVVLNVWRWRTGMPEYEYDLDDYRSYVINHELGHQLWEQHKKCPGAGKLAPIMMQQSKGLDGCLPNPWPYPEPN